MRLRTLMAPSCDMAWMQESNLVWLTVTALSQNFNSLCTNLVLVLSGQNVGNFTATVLSRLARERAAGRPLGGISRHVGKLKIYTIELRTLAYLYEPVKKAGRRAHFSARIEVNYKYTRKSMKFSKVLQVKSQKINCNIY